MTPRTRFQYFVSLGGAAVPALLIASAVFGLVHIDFVLRNKDTSGGDDGAGAAGAAGDDARTWFIVTARYGALYGALFTLSGHRVIAPACAHAALNTGITLRDWRAMRGARAPADP